MIDQLRRIHGLTIERYCWTGETYVAARVGLLAGTSPALLDGGPALPPHLVSPPDDPFECMADPPVRAVMALMAIWQHAPGAPKAIDTIMELANRLDVDPLGERLLNDVVDEIKAHRLLIELAIAVHAQVDPAMPICASPEISGIDAPPGAQVHTLDTEIKLDAFASQATAFGQVTEVDDPKPPRTVATFADLPTSAKNRAVIRVLGPDTRVTLRKADSFYPMDFMWLERAKVWVEACHGERIES